MKKIGRPRKALVRGGIQRPKIAKVFFEKINAVFKIVYFFHMYLEQIERVHVWAAPVPPQLEAVDVDA